MINHQQKPMPRSLLPILLPLIFAPICTNDINMTGCIILPIFKRYAFISLLALIVLTESTCSTHKLFSWEHGKKIFLEKLNTYLFHLLFVSPPVYLSKYINSRVSLLGTRSSWLSNICLFNTLNVSFYMNNMIFIKWHFPILSNIYFVGK